MEYYKLPEERPAFNFYKADEDITYMLKGNRNVMLTDLNKMDLISSLINLREWFSLNYNKSAYEKNLNKMKRKIVLENKIIAYEGVLLLVRPFDKMLLSEVLSAELLTKIKEVCKAVELPYIDYSNDFKASVERYIKGVTNDLNMLKSSLKEEVSEFNYVRHCITIGKALSIQIEPMKITLIEWCEILKLANEQHTGNV